MFYAKSVIEELQSVGSWSLLCDIIDERIERKTPETGRFYANPATEELIETRLKLVVSVRRQR